MLSLSCCLCRCPSRCPLCWPSYAVPHGVPLVLTLSRSLSRCRALPLMLSLSLFPSRPPPLVLTLSCFPSRSRPLTLALLCSPSWALPLIVVLSILRLHSRTLPSHSLRLLAVLFSLSLVALCKISMDFKQCGCDQKNGNIFATPKSSMVSQHLLAILLQAKMLGLLSW